GQVASNGARAHFLLRVRSTSHAEEQSIRQDARQTRCSNAPRLALDVVGGASYPNPLRVGVEDRVRGLRFLVARLADAADVDQDSIRFGEIDLLVDRVRGPKR